MIAAPMQPVMSRDGGAVSVVTSATRRASYAVMKRILFKTTIPRTDDDWHVGRFSLLLQQLESQGFAVTARDRAGNTDGDDADLIELPDSHFDQLWLFAVDVGAGLSAVDARAIRRFARRGGGLVFTRDHHDLGACLLKLGEIGHAHFFNSANREPEPERQCVDDVANRAIGFPNYHSGRNGDLQQLEPAGPVHALLRRDGSDVIARFPAHPHEGVVGVPEAARAYARVIARGRSLVSGRSFNSVVAFDPGQGRGRAVAHSSFHHFADYNWDPRLGCPSFVADSEGNQVLADANALEDIHAYVRNLARWLAGDPT
jgi:hypothetical protein